MIAEPQRLISNGENEHLEKHVLWNRLVCALHFLKGLRILEPPSGMENESKTTYMFSI